MKAGHGRERRLALFALLVILRAAAMKSRRAPPSTRAGCRRERPKWFAAMRRTEAKYGVPVAVQLATIAREFELRRRRAADQAHRQRLFSRKVPRSSAYGYAQALDGTWDDYRRSTGRRGADRDDFADASDFIGWYMNEAARVNGLAPHDAYNQYLAYHEGRAGYARGTYRAKAWLPGVARDVEAWSVVYQTQLQSCPARLTVGAAAPRAYRRAATARRRGEAWIG